ncbi:hypothetical protein ACWCP6_19830 [Streptomyces sp. NPDC002004]
MTVLEAGAGCEFHPDGRLPLLYIAVTPLPLRDTSASDHPLTALVGATRARALRLLVRKHTTTEPPVNSLSAQRPRPCRPGPSARPGRSPPSDAVLCFKLDNRHLALALEGTGTDSPYRTDPYERWHTLLRDLLEQIPGLTDSDFAAHALLAATRADLVE